MRVLLVDDNRLMLEGLRNLLEVHDVQVAGMAADGQQAFDLVRTLKPDVILMDIRMPRCDGLTATRLIKAEMPEMKIIILTTSSDDQDLFEAVKSGASGYLLKSINADTLIESLIQAQDGIPPFSPGLAAKLLKEFALLSESSAAGSSNASASANSSSATGYSATGASAAGATAAGSSAAARSIANASAANSSAPDLSANPPQSSATLPMRGLNSRQTEVLTLVSQGLSYKEVGARMHLSPRTIRYHMVEIMNLLHMENRAQVLAYAGRHGVGQDATHK